MTTKVVIACPDNSVHDGLIYLEHRNDDGTWTRAGEPIAVSPRTTAAPLYIDSATRVTIEESGRDHVEPQATKA